MPSQKPGLHHSSFLATYLEVHSTFQFQLILFLQMVISYNYVVIPDKLTDEL